MLFSESYKIMVNKGTFLGFKGESRHLDATVSHIAFYLIVEAKRRLHHLVFSGCYGFYPVLDESSKFTTLMEHATFVP